MIADLGWRILDCQGYVHLLFSGMDAKELKERTKSFTLRVLTMTEALPKNTTGKVFSGQIARSKAEFIAIFVASIKSARK